MYGRKMNVCLADGTAMVVVPFVPCDLVGVDSLTDTERGTDGFGSTGID